MQDLIQGRFQYEWVQQMPTGSPGGAMRSRGRTTVSKPTLAQLGHQKGAEMRLAKQAQMAPEVAASQFKMSKVGHLTEDISTPRCPARLS